MKQSYHKAQDEAAINQQVKLLVRRKMVKFINPSTEAEKEDLKESIKERERIRRDHYLHKRPIWETWGTDEHKLGNKIGFFSHKEVFGNNLKGREWVQEQQIRQKHFVFEPGELKSIPKENSKEIQFTYIEPSPSEEKLQALRMIGHQFQDDDFPANQSSLNGEFGPDPEWDVIQWKRIRYMIPNSQIFQGKVEPNDIKQGYLGDCYFLAGLAALAERPDRIFNLFLLRQKNELSYYSVKILYRGKWRIVDLDDSIPFVFGTPAFSRSIENELWVILLEKAWAKLYGSYKQIEAGFAEEPLHDLTGAPIKHLFLTHKSYKTDDQWKYLIEASLKQYAMVAGSNTDTDLPVSETGIIRGHAYTFLNAIEIETREGKQRIVQIRNPQSRGQFKGKWADDHPIWNQISEAEKARVHYVKNSEDGVFFMNFDDFTSQFRSITIAEISDNASYVYESSYDPEKKGVYFSITVLHESNYCLQIDKTPERSLSIQKQKLYNYPQSILQIGRIDQKTSEMLEGAKSRKKTLFKNYRLVPGKYVAFVWINFDSKYEQDFQVTLAVYSDFSCGITIATKDDVFKLTGKQGIDWDGLKKRKPAPIKTPSEVKSTTLICIGETSEKQVRIIEGSQQITENKPKVSKPYRYQTEAERHNPFFMFGLEDILIQQTQTFKEEVGKTSLILPASKEKNKPVSKQKDMKKKPSESGPHPTAGINQKPGQTNTGKTQVKENPSPAQELVDSRTYTITKNKEENVTISIKSQLVNSVNLGQLTVKKLNQDPEKDNRKNIPVVSKEKKNSKSKEKPKKIFNESEAKANKQEKISYQKTYIDCLIQNVMGITNNYARNKKQVNKPKIGQMLKASQEIKTHEPVKEAKPVKAQKSECKHDIVQNETLKSEGKKQAKEISPSKLYMSQTLPEKKQVGTEQKKESAPTYSGKTQKQKLARQSLKKRRKQKDILRYQDQTELKNNNILFDLWPKLLQH